MPVTPFHFGAGLLAKGLAPRHVSLSGFLLTQVAIDCESGYFLLRGEWPAHRFVHTLIGASILCGFTVLLTSPLLTWGFRRLGSGADAGLARWIALAPPATAPVLAATAVLGVLGHVIPDAIMHSDMRPFAPFSDWNPIHKSLSLGHLHIGLLLAGLLGLVVVLFRRSRFQTSSDQAPPNA